MDNDKTQNGIYCLDLSRQMLSIQPHHYDEIIIITLDKDSNYFTYNCKTESIFELQEAGGLANLANLNHNTKN